MGANIRGGKLGIYNPLLRTFWKSKFNKESIIPNINIKRKLKEYSSIPYTLAQLVRIVLNDLNSSFEGRFLASLLSLEN
jgi:hypothetical protein